MSAAGGLLSTLAGVGLVGLAARDVFDALFHPEGRASLARIVMRSVWRLFRRAPPGPRTFPLAGPVGLVAVIATWVTLLALGWGLIYWPHVPDGFSFAHPGQRGTELVDALNLSLVSLTTLGFGDVTPEAAWLRIVVPLEAVVGFGLLSASISWLLLTYPVLSRRRSLAYEISLLRQAEDDTALALDRLEPEAAERVYAELTSRLVAVERDLVNFPVSYYFAEGDERFSLPAVAPYLLTLAERGARDDMPERVRLRARLLLEALDDLAATTGKRFLGVIEGSTPEMLAAYARDHLRDPEKTQ
jgi:Ion channel